jgi:hypothetical protein
MPTAILWLALLLILTILILYFMNYTTDIPSLKLEGFVVKTCPEGKETYITDDGITNCCSGEVINNRCENVFCSLSPGEKNSCTNVLIDQSKRRSEAKCPPSISADCRNYFTNRDGTVKGCSKSSVTSDFSGPSDTSLPHCRLYSTDEDNTRNHDSCQNYLARFNAVAGLATCNTELARVRASIPAPAATVAAVPSMAQPMLSRAAPATPVNPTGYVIYGEGISGDLPVGKIINKPARGSDEGINLYLAQDASVLRVVFTNTEYTNILESGNISGNLSQFTDFDSFIRNAGGYSRGDKYNIKKADGTGILLAKQGR